MSERLAIGLVYAAALYPLALCFLNTRVARMSTASIVISEMLILALALPALLARINLPLMLLALCVSLNFFVLALLQQSSDLKPLRDWLMPVIFVWLGYIVADRHVAERVLRNLAIIATVLALVEFVFPGFYTSLFDAIAFYAARGFGEGNKFALTVLQVRPAGIGRSLLPFLGPRRMSSFFLEPVALGNFAVLTGAWALAKPKGEWRQTVLLLALAVAMIVMADARFGSITVLCLFVAVRTGFWKVKGLYVTLPFVAIAALLTVGWVLGPRYIGDTLLGRFQLSGNNLLTIDWWSWFGIPSLISLDAGYGYIIQRTGIVICTLLWIAFARMPIDSGTGRRFHFMATIYIALNLCISGSSLFALKTSAILWFLLGSVIAHQTAVRHLPFPPWFQQRIRPAAA